MSLNDVSTGERIHITFFGIRNAGKSSLVNAITGQNLSVVSDVKGTTTDIVQKNMELLPLGPVVITDTPGIDDEGALGELRIKATQKALAKTNIAVLVVDAQAGIGKYDNDLISIFNEKKIPYVVAYNKSDLVEKSSPVTKNEIFVSAKNNINIHELKEMLGALAKDISSDKKILADIVSQGDTVILVMPIDKSAPKGRIILPQQQTLRELLDLHCTAICVQANELKNTIDSLKNDPSLVITDSQVFNEVNTILPQSIPLTSFSILFARYKGNLRELVNGASTLSNLKNGDKILISEGCTHHRQCNDIGSVKIPKMLQQFSGADLKFEFSSGSDYPENISDFALIIHCGGCMLNEAEMLNRIEKAQKAHVPIVNYGMAIAHMNGILKRSLEPLSAY